MIREIWNSLVGVIKLVFFNPNRLAMGDLLKEAMRLLGLGVYTLVGTYIHTHLNTLLNFPLGAELSSFVSAIVTGILNLGFVYFLEHSELTNKVWTFLNQFKPKLLIEQGIDYMREVNAELDRYLLELSKIEFNMNPLELKEFSNNLDTANSELEKHFILKAEANRRGIELPYDSDNLESVRNWLKKIGSNKK
ncbi:hypothetical protein [Rodentibacter genomosp. 1]|uniref:hypothetical protein n=1 Tax=Rodentibacter genomosp. 1 TaxID=1908264 RepID=UPI000986249D|nr:hypothetical protein [Rodentibacter genomosp. 1]